MKNLGFFIEWENSFKKWNYSTIFLKYRNKKVTLYSLKANSNFQEILSNTKKYGILRPDFIFHGCYFLSESEMFFDYIDIYLDKLNHWIDNFLIDKDTIKSRKKIYTDISYFESNNIGFEFLYKIKKLKKDIKFSNNYTFFHKGSLIKKRFVRIYPKGLNFKQCWENIIIPFKYMIAIAYNNLETSNVYEIKAVKKNKEYKIEFLSEMSTTNYYFPMVFMPSNFDFKVFKKYSFEIINNWLRIFFKIKDLIYLFTHAFKQINDEDFNEMYDPGLFLSYAQILESIHRTFYNKNPFHIDEWKIIKKNLFNSVESNSISNEKKEKLIKKIINLNQMSLMERLNDIKIRFHKTISIFMNDFEYTLFAKYFVKSRNYYTHYSDYREYIIDGENLYNLSLKTGFLINILIFEMLIPQRTHLLSYGFSEKGFCYEKNKYD